MPYDSDEGRALSGVIMAILCGEAYLMSTHIAERLGAFQGYSENRAGMLRVIGKHKAASEKLPSFASLETLTEAARDIWRIALERGVEHGYRNSQATVLAPTGTIAFLMDCDTTGIEPDIALVKYKKLVGGGLLKIVNQSVPQALSTLGYNGEEISQLVKYIDEHDTIEGAPALKPEHLPVFDCAFKPMKGQRSIAPLGHIKMMAAVQPFVSGAISKTVNMPANATAEDIYNAYVEAWRLGLKAIAIYRDGSKRSQPLATKKDEGKAKSGTDREIKRRHLPDERHAITHKFNIAGHEGYITAGLYDDGSPGEIFLVMAKEGSTLSGVMDAFATSISLALQYGVPLSALVKKFSHMRFEPAGFTHNKDIPLAKSILDYIFRWMALKFLSPEKQAEVGVRPTGSGSAAKTEGNSGEKTETNQQKTSQAKEADANSAKKNGAASSSASMVGFELSEDAPPCSVCGSSLMVRQGACYHCLTCGSQGGCG